MTMLRSISFVCGISLLPACVVSYGLGETAEASSEGSDEGSTGGSDSTPDPSATSGQPGTTAEPSTNTTTGGGFETSAEETTGGFLGQCDPHNDALRWVFNGEGGSPLAGIEPTYVALLEGDCTVGELDLVEPDQGTWDYSLPLQCSLSGRVDDDPNFSGELSPVLQLRGTVHPSESLVSVGEQVRLVVVLDWEVVNWNAWLVLLDPDGTLLFETAEAEYTTPTESIFAAEASVLRSDWHGPIVLEAVNDQCDSPIGRCNALPQAIAVGLETEPLQIVHPLQTAVMDYSNMDTPWWYRVSVTAASFNPQPTCTDVPLANYAFTMWRGV